jgi:hypothetical protein
MQSIYDHVEAHLDESMELQAPLVRHTRSPKNGPAILKGKKRNLLSG